MPQQLLNVRAIIFDWAGTMIDHGSRAPASVFQAIFETEGVGISEAQAREPMGKAKREHIQSILAMPSVADRWQQVKGEAAAVADVDRMYARFLPLQKSVLADHCDLIPGAADTARWCVENGIRIAATTGYTRELMEIVLSTAESQGYCPEVSLGAEDAPQGRPAPWMIFEIAKRLNVYPLSQCIKVDDTLVGIEAGLNAGCWTVAVTKTGNELGMSEADLGRLAADDLADRLASARNKFQQHGAHAVVESVLEIPAIVTRINERLSQGERP